MDKRDGGVVHGTATHTLIPMAGSSYFSGKPRGQVWNPFLSDPKALNTVERTRILLKTPVQIHGNTTSFLHLWRCHLPPPTPSCFSAHVFLEQWMELVSRQGGIYTHEKILKGSLTQIALISVGGLLVWIHFNWSHRGCRDEEVSSSSLSRQCSLWKVKKNKGTMRSGHLSYISSV